jgi:DNA-directed RNA polymerase specialized sigma24 family protein
LHRAGAASSLSGCKKKRLTSSTGDAAKALEAFQITLREAASLSARRQLPDDRFWCFHQARHQCILIAQNDVQPESSKLPEEAIAPGAAELVAHLEPTQLAVWIAAAPEPQRSALAYFYLNEFSHREMQNLLDLKRDELAELIAHGRTQFQAWLNTVAADLTPE